MCVSVSVCLCGVKSGVKTKHTLRTLCIVLHTLYVIHSIFFFFAVTLDIKYKDISFISPPNWKKGI